MWYFANGDAGFYFTEQLRQLSWLPVLWHPEYGFGVSTLTRIWFDYPYELMLKVLSSIGFSWRFIDKLLWISVLVLGIYSAHKLATYILGNGKASILSSIIYVSNTYILLLFGGGQIGVSLAYAFAPLVFYRIIKYGKSNLKEQIINGLCLALLVSFDLRIAFLVVVATIFWWYRHIFSLFIAASVHLFWILPVILVRGGISDLGEQFTDPGMLKFLSVADFSHSLGLLHPNWPENLFGKVYFLQPEFLVLPILAFGSLLFVTNIKNQEQRTKNHLLFFALLALVGAFFAKGVNPPGGGLFVWMFTHVHGFVMFRDPTKFYLYIAMGYSVLIPYTLQKINKKIVYALFVLFWIFTLRSYSVHVTNVPQEYVQLKNILTADTVPSRTLWIPQKESTAYFSDVHPILTATAAASIDPSVKYVIVPIDVNKRIFLNDYKYDSTIREHLIEELSQKQLLRDDRFHDLAVFENPAFTGMHGTIPVIVGKQQQLANIGLGISIGFLFFWLTWIFLH
jgi:hypothetical protein